MTKFFIWIEETNLCINEFKIGYIINLSLHVNIAFRYQVEIFMNTTFGSITQPFIKPHYKKRTQVC